MRGDDGSVDGSVHGSIGGGTGGLGRAQRLILALLALAAVVIAGAVVVLLTIVGDEPRQRRVVISPYVNVVPRALSGGDETVLTVTSDAPAYWRLASLDVHENGIWKVEGAFDAERPDDAAPEPADTAAGPIERRSIVQDIEIGALGAIWVPAAPDPVDLLAVGPGDDLSIQFDADLATLSVDVDRANSNGLRYTIVSSVVEPSPDQLRALGRADPDRLGPSVFDASGTPDRVGALARALTDGLTTDYDRAMAVQAHLRSLTLDQGATVPAEVDPMNHLLDTGRGASPQFAGTFAAMMRTIGVPSRVAVGFTTGDEAGAGADGRATYLVGNRHAHAWPEIHIDGVGWIAFEPTPGFNNPLAAAYAGSG